MGDDEATARVIRLVQRASRKRSVWPPVFTAHWLSARILDATGATVRPFEVGDILDRFGVFRHGRGQVPARRQTAELQAALPEMAAWRGASSGASIDAGFGKLFHHRLIVSQT